MLANQPIVSSFILHDANRYDNLEVRFSSDKTAKLVFFDRAGVKEKTIDLS